MNKYELKLEEIRDQIHFYQIDNNKIALFDDAEEELGVFELEFVKSAIPNYEKEYEDFNGDSNPEESIPRKLNLSTFDKTLIDIKSMYDREKLKLNPEWQRDYVWNNRKASLLIESLLVNIPVPPVYIAESIIMQDGSADEMIVYDVVDGKQRITSILNFMNDKFRLSGLGIQKGLNGKKYSELSPKIKDTLDEAVLRVIRINYDTDSLTKFDLFYRINTGSAKLSKQEVRNAMYIDKKIQAQVRAIINSEYYEGFEFAKSKRKKDQETILRCLGFVRDAMLKEDTYKNSINQFIVDLYERDDVKEKHIEKFLHILSFIKNNNNLLIPFLKSGNKKGSTSKIKPRPSYLESLFYVLAEEEVRFDYNKDIGVTTEYVKSFEEELDDDAKYLFSKSSPSFDNVLKRRNIIRRFVNGLLS